MKNKCYHTEEGYLIPYCWGTTVHGDIDFCHCSEENLDRIFTLKDIKQMISELEHKCTIQGFDNTKELHQAQSDIQSLKRTLKLLNKRL